MRLVRFVEGTISQVVQAFGLRYCRYIGFEKTQLQHIITAAAINVVRLTQMCSKVSDFNEINL